MGGVAHRRRDGDPILDALVAEEFGGARRWSTAACTTRRWGR
ncbi:MAG: hypothetical protein U0232_23515 [Thermomicrobiales bacterium]